MKTENFTITSCFILLILFLSKLVCHLYPWKKNLGITQYSKTGINRKCSWATLICKRNREFIADLVTSSGIVRNSIKEVGSWPLLKSLKKLRLILLFLVESHNNLLLFFGMDCGHLPLLPAPLPFLLVLLGSSFSLGNCSSLTPSPGSSGEGHSHPQPQEWMCGPSLVEKHTRATCWAYQCQLYQPQELYLKTQERILFPEWLNRWKVSLELLWNILSKSREYLLEDEDKRERAILKAGTMFLRILFYRLEPAVPEGLLWNCPVYILPSIWLVFLSLATENLDHTLDHKLIRT